MSSTGHREDHTTCLWREGPRRRMLLPVQVLGHISTKGTNVEPTTSETTTTPRVPSRQRRAAALPPLLIDEREAIAREVHVGLAQSASAVLLGLDILRATALEAAPGELERLERLATRNGREVRRLMAFLRAPRDRGLLACLEDYVDDVEVEGSPVTLTVEDTDGDAVTDDRVFRFIHRSLAALERSGAVGALGITVAPLADGAVLVRIDSAGKRGDAARSLQGIASEAAGAPVVVRAQDGGIQLEAVIR